MPHSEIRGSKVVRTSPRLIAAYHVLHRLLPPRHPSNALKSLDCSHYQCPLGSGIIDEKKTRSCEINPIAARFVLLALRRSRVEPQAYPFFTMVRSVSTNALSVRENVFSPLCDEKTKSWWSQTGSNRRPQACKASALPTELWPQTQTSITAYRKRWWAWVELNYRPHAYQACALTT